MSRKKILVLFSIVIFVVQVLMLYLLFYQDSEWRYVSVLSVIMMVASILPILIQYFMLSHKPLSVRKLNAVMLLNVDWFTLWYIFLIILGVMSFVEDGPDFIVVGMHKFVIFYPLAPFFFLLNEPCSIVTVVFITIKSIMYILLQRALEKEGPVLNEDNTMKVIKRETNGKTGYEITL